jgi:hypothetical protein
VAADWGESEDLNMTLQARLLGLGLSLGLALGPAAPAAADWTTQAGGGAVLMRQQDQGWTIEMRCARSTPNVLGVVIAGPAADSLAGVTTVGIGAELPGGDRRGAEVPVTSRGQVATGNWRVNDRALEIFAQGLTMGIRLGDTGRTLTTDMRGTAAGRSAIRSQCGF